MSEKQRLDIPQAIYYVELKSNGHRNLFSDRESFLKFESLLPQAFDEQETSTLGYCLAQESVHLILRAGSKGIAEAASWLSQQYTHFYNDHNHRNGSVFSSHPCITLLDPRTYLLAAAKQLHFLPVLTGLVAEPSIYPWSSHHHYLNDLDEPWFEKNPLLTLVSQRRNNWVKHYENAMTLPPEEELDWQQGNNLSYRALASTQYIEKLIAAQEPDIHQTPSLEWLKQHVCEEFHLQDQDLQLWRRHRLASEVKGVITTLALLFDTANMEEISDFLEEDKEILENSVRSLNAHRGHFTHKLFLKLQTQLVVNLHSEEVPTLIEMPDSGTTDAESSVVGIATSDG